MNVRISLSFWVLNRPCKGHPEYILVREFSNLSYNTCTVLQFPSAKDISKKCVSKFETLL